MGTAEMQDLSRKSRKHAGSDRAGTAGRNVRPHVLLLTGRPGVGKTTVIRRVAEGSDETGLRGFYTEEIREHGERKGFRLLGFNGEDRVIAHVDFPKAHRVSKYGVDLTAIDDAASLLAHDLAVRLYVVDEIGKMECLSVRFVTAMRKLLAGNTPVVASVGLHGGGFIAEVKRLRQCLLWEVTQDNRDKLPSCVLTWLTETQSYNHI
jgi:nucleoside-triphosphatase